MFSADFLLLFFVKLYRKAANNTFILKAAPKMLGKFTLEGLTSSKNLKCFFDGPMTCTFSKKIESMKY